MKRFTILLTAVIVAATVMSALILSQAPAKDADVSSSEVVLQQSDTSNDFSYENPGLESEVVDAIPVAINLRSSVFSRTNPDIDESDDDSEIGDFGKIDDDDDSEDEEVPSGFFNRPGDNAQPKAQPKKVSKIPELKLASKNELPAIPDFESLTTMPDDPVKKSLYNRIKKDCSMKKSKALEAVDTFLNDNQAEAACEEWVQTIDDLKKTVKAASDDFAPGTFDQYLSVLEKCQNSTRVILSRPFAHAFVNCTKDIENGEDPDWVTLVDSLEGFYRVKPVMPKTALDKFDAQLKTVRLHFKYHIKQNDINNSAVQQRLEVILSKWDREIQLRNLDEPGGTKQTNGTKPAAPVSSGSKYVGAFENRGAGKARAVLLGGGTTESERAVALGLQWIALHQLPNGEWNFDHKLAPSCRGACSNPGNLDKSLNAATALAILPFLGAGVTHKDGVYKLNVNKGLRFLCRNGKFDQKKQMVSYIEPGGTIYSHGITAICLSEAYAMTKDKSLLPAAQGSLKYIVFHQDPAGGGWRYSPQQRGDTSASGWQIAALKTGYWSGLQVPSQTITKAIRFFDYVQTDNGAKYGYTDPGQGAATTAVGLMCRMYLGWRHENPTLQRGVEWLSKIGPSKSDSYHNYYATQVMYQYGGPLWEKWNAVMRNMLVNSQSLDGHEKGSWHFNGSWSSRGGRLYDTSFSILTLEVYYRYMRIYEAAAAANR